VAFEIGEPLQPLAHCHCSMCRKGHGAAFASFASARAGSFRWLEREGVRYYGSSPGASRPFCGRCGSKLPSDAYNDTHFVPLGLLDGDPQLGPAPHIFVGSKAPWYEIPDDGLPRFPEFPPGMGQGVETKRTTDPAPGVLRGSCLCGKVAYEVSAPIPMGIVRCHCTRCRKARAAAHNANFFVGLDDFRWLRGEDLLLAYKVPEAERFAQAFCGECGSPQPRVVNRAVVPAGSLDDDPGAVPGMHIFVSSKAPWFEIRDALPQYAEYPPSP
jgi:hypothetical protein